MENTKSMIQTPPVHRVIFFSGLPKAGKSVTLHAINKMALSAGRGREIFLERVHPDQEGGDVEVLASIAEIGLSSQSGGTVARAGKGVRV